MAGNEVLKMKDDLNEALTKLVEIRDKLQEVNRITGAMARFEAMKQEIQENGWDGILAKYHPDINMDDPAAFQLFEMYRFAYDAIQRGR